MWIILIDNLKFRYQTWKDRRRSFHYLMYGWDSTGVQDEQYIQSSIY